MTLLREVTERPLDPGYAAAAAARATAGTGAGPAWSRRRALLTAVLAVLAGVLLTSAVLALRVPANSTDRTELVQEVAARTHRGDARARQVERLRTQVQGIQDRALADVPDAPQPGEDLLVASGSVAVTGPGVRIAVDDAPSTDDTASGDPRDVDPDDDGLVRYSDLQVVVNGLWSSGAEAIAINGQRLTTSSAIRNAGAAILVNYRPLSPPYKVDAIGSPNALQTRFAMTVAASFLLTLHRQDHIAVSVDAEDRLALPARDTQQLYYAKVLPPQPSAAASGSPSSAAPSPSSSTTQGARS